MAHRQVLLLTQWMFTFSCSYMSKCSPVEEQRDRRYTEATTARANLSAMCQMEDDIYDPVKWLPPALLGSPEVINVYLKRRGPLTTKRGVGPQLSVSLFPPSLTHAVKEKQINDTICPENHIKGSMHRGEKLFFHTPSPFSRVISVQIKHIPVWHLSRCVEKVGAT